VKESKYSGSKRGASTLETSGESEIDQGTMDLDDTDADSLDGTKRVGKRKIADEEET